MSESAFISRDTAVITGNYTAELLGQRLEAVRARLCKMNERLPEDAAPWGWTLKGDELARVKEQYPHLVNRKVVVVVTERGLRELAIHTRTPEAAAIRRQPANKSMLIFKQLARRTMSGTDMEKIAGIEQLQSTITALMQQEKENSAVTLDKIGRDKLMPPGFATIETLAQHDPNFNDVSEAQSLVNDYHVEMRPAFVMEDGRLIPVDAYNIAEYRSVSARKAVEYGLM
ncbi:hypothetical protein NLN96_18810 [Citrobacter portucalensis]|uniref:hypothetical protein n=1 Tax=Citrobacter portucalensis TaxID=1639133 RepID=UPI00226BAB8B|nr:hypothetical protein [Citrobacter portucalensis]MCX9019049.1 hypothetical protein [Citrobacter portucalensis]